MDQNELRKSVRNFIQENFIFDKDYSFQDDSSFLDEGIIDSTGILELVAFLEENFHIKVEDEELIPDNLDSVNNIIHYLQKKVSKISVLV